jgi:hypothetical protein
VTSRTTVSELKTSFIEAITNTLNQMRDPEPEPEVKAELATLLPLSTEDDPDPDPTVKTIKLFKQSEDEQGDEKWIPLDDDKANVDRIGLDQGHVVGVSFANKRGELYSIYVV